jgi:hypothetical protein
MLCIVLRRSAVFESQELMVRPTRSVLEVVVPRRVERHWPPISLISSSPQKDFSPELVENREIY